MAKRQKEEPFSTRAVVCGKDSLVVWCVTILNAATSEHKCHLWPIKMSIISKVTSHRLYLHYCRVFADSICEDLLEELVCNLVHLIVEVPLLWVPEKNCVSVVLFWKWWSMSPCEREVCVCVIAVICDGCLTYSLWRSTLTQTTRCHCHILTQIYLNICSWSSKKLNVGLLLTLRIAINKLASFHLMCFLNLCHV